MVDSNGCALDSDGDGVPDYADKCPDTPRGLKADENGCPFKMDLALTFEFNSAKVDAASTEKVKAFAQFLQENPAYSVKIVGYTDSIGSAEGNQKVSEHRAGAVRTMLIDNGIDASRVTAEGRGEAEPIADNATKEGRDANRRISAELSN
jgi:OOP family OmpA-OmpF porin